MLLAFLYTKCILEFKACARLDGLILKSKETSE